MSTLLALALTAHAGKAPDAEATTRALFEAAMASDRTWDRLVVLADDIGPRLAGSEGLERAIAWGEAAMREDGLANVRTEPVTIDAWIRGEERAALLAPVAEPLPILGLGSSVPTPEGGLEAEVVVVDSFDHLEALGEAVRGKIVLYDVPFTAYEDVSPYRMRGPSRAAAKGAVAVLLRSVGPDGTGHHTGTILYDAAWPQIPAAAVTAEDASRLRRYAERGLAVRVRLEMASTREERPSANVVGEVVGARKPREVVVLACHLDSWDVGRGAQDDGAGCVSVMEAARLLAGLPTPPARTIRVVLYSNEENGLSGGFAYAATHADAIARHVAAIESDLGAGPIQGFGVDVREGRDFDPDAAAALAATLQPAVPALAPVGDLAIAPGFGGVDLLPLAWEGVPTFGAELDTTGYWPIHHTAADTLDKIDPETLKRNTAAIAIFAWWLAEHPPVLRSADAGTPREGR